MKHILIVGKKFSGLTGAIEKAGYEYTVLKDITTTRFPDKKLKRRVVADFSSTERLLATVDILHDKHPIDGVITVYENYILPTAQIGKHLNLPHLPIKSAEACTDKFLMRTLFDTASEKISPAFATVHSEEDVRIFAAAHSFPLILKPANLAKSLLVTRSDSLEELVANYQKSVQLLESTYKKYAPNRKASLIIEEFLEGSIHSVDAFVGNDGEPLVLDQIVDYKTGYDIGYDDNFHYSRVIPSALTASDQAKLRHCAKIGVRALGIENSPAHIEVIMTKDGPRIVEIGARNGGYRERMHHLANNIDITRAALALALGETPNATSTKNESVAVLELFPKLAGQFKEIHNEQLLRNLPSLTYLSIKPKPGEFVGKSGDGYKMCAVVILHNKDAAIFKQDLDTVTSSIFVSTEPITT
jgi:biotin carboxylase